MELGVAENDIVFDPSLEIGAGDSFFDLVDSICGDVYRQAEHVGRIAPHLGEEHYRVHWR